MWRLRKEPRADGPRGSFFFKRPREPEPLGLEIGHRLLARRRVTAINCIARAVAYENRPEPGFSRWGLLRTHDVANAVFAVEHCEATRLSAFDALKRVSIGTTLKRYSGQLVAILKQSGQ